MISSCNLTFCGKIIAGVVVCSIALRPLVLWWPVTSVPSAIKITGFTTPWRRSEPCRRTNDSLDRCRGL
ncbi:hypothetical protein ADK70_34430 [Streptomyces rimosus subsp. pseudoverticillatus]|nr:hypothetical protein ADK70_34430 [Streptomyces rimosus subsp. pseudoverticillatus]